MKLSDYISDLLYRYECVIIPNFGGFVTNHKSAEINSYTNTIYPPLKQISFNSHLKNNDGLLANYIASKDQMKFECALNYIKFEVEEWNKQLESQDLELKGIGTFTLNQDKIIFEPDTKVNYLTSSFGLETISNQEIRREKYIKQVEQIEKKAPIIFTPERKKAPNYLKYAAIFILGFSSLGIAGKLYKDYQNEQFLSNIEKQQIQMENKIEKATFTISKPLPALKLDLDIQKKNFHVIAGAFRFSENAYKKVSELKSQGYNAKILGINKWGLTVVSFESYSSKEESYQNLARIRQLEDKDAWLLVQEF